MEQRQTQVDHPQSDAPGSFKRRPRYGQDKNEAQRRLLLQRQHPLSFHARTLAPAPLSPSLTWVSYRTQPDPTAMISCIPGLEGPKGPKYEPILSGDYYAKALEAEIGV